MANIKKSFNFRNGFQVDDDNVVVNSNGLVGIGTTIPLEILDVYGNLKVSGIATLRDIFTRSIQVVGFTTLSRGSIGLASFTSSGIVTATSGILTYYGDGGSLLNLPTSQWIDVDTGLGFTSIYAQGNVGVATLSPLFTFQVGGVGNNISQFALGLGIGRVGDVYTTGVITSTAASGGFSGSGANLTNINASNVSSGTLSSNRLPIIPNDKLPSNINLSGIITAASFSGNFIGSVTGSVVGIASTAINLVSTANVSITQITAGFATCGLTTIAKLNVINQSTSGTIGINTTTHRSDLHISKTAGISSILLTSSPSEVSLISLGRGFGTRNGGLRFGKSSTVDVFNYEKYSNPNALDIINYDSSNLNSYISNSNAKFHWIYRTGSSEASPVMTLTSSGKLIVGSATTVPGEETLRVTGILTVTNNSPSFFDGNVFVKGNIEVSGTNNFNIDNKTLYSTTGVSTASDLQVLSQLTVSGPNPYDNLGNYAISIGDWTDDARRCIVASETNIGIGTTNVRNITIGGISTDYRLDAYEASGLFRSVSVGTTNPAAYVDFSAAGQVPGGANYRFMIVPKATSTNITSLVPQSGGLVYDTTINQFRGYNGSSWQSLGSKNYPENDAGTGSYTIQASDIGKTILVARSGGPVTVAIPNTLSGLAVGDVIIVFNSGASVGGGGGSITIAHDTETNLLFADNLTGDRTLSDYGVATLLCVDITGGISKFVIYGNGIT